MKKNATIFALTLVMMGAALAEEAVVRVQSIKPAKEGSTPVLQRQRPTEPPFAVSVNAAGYPKDHFITDANTVAALEFLIGGKVSINKNTDIIVVDEKSVADGKTSVKRVILKSGAMWVKADAKTLKQPMEIQTSGGVMGIKGTEFTVEEVGGSSEVCCFESNSEQGGVEVRDNSGKVVGVVKPGEQFKTDFKSAPVVKTYENVEEFRETKLRSTFNEAWSYLNQAMSVANMFGAGAYLPGNVYTGLSYASMGVNLVTDPENAAISYAESYANSYIPGPFGVSIPRNNKPKQPDFPTQLSPDGAHGAGPMPNRPSFSWKGVDGAAGYVVMISSDENANDNRFTTLTRETQVVYPDNHQPLAPGKYFWRVIPVDSEDQPVKKASQTYFTVQ